jgi:hypothetical protein
MILWNTSRLANLLAAGRVTSAEKFRYLFLGQILIVVLGYVFYFLPLTTGGWLYFYEAVMILVTTGAGLVRCRESYAGATDDRLLESFLVLSVPLTIKVTILSWAPATVVYWAMTRYADKIDVSSPFAVEFVQFAYRFLYVFTPFVAAVGAAFCFWWRMGTHLRTVASGSHAA